MYKRKHLEQDVGKRQYYRRVAKENEIAFNQLKNIHKAENVHVQTNSDIHQISNSNKFDMINQYNHVEENNLESDNNDTKIFDKTHENESEFSENFEENNSFSCGFYTSHNSNTYSNGSDNLTSALRQWAVESKVSHHSVTSLLKILVTLHPELPLDSRSLLKTPRKSKMKQIDDGEYCHFGVEHCLKQIIPSQCFDKILKLSINIDGTPLFSSSKLQFWPILGLLKNFESFPFAIGIFCGKSKPSSLNIFLEDFIDDIKILNQTGFFLHNRVYFVEILNFICDAPAKAYLKGIKSHGGYASCEKCWEYGVYNDKARTVIFKGTNSSLRTDEQFKLGTDEEHHKTKSPLLDLNIGLVSSFTIDYMHAVCLGVVKKLLSSWVCGNLNVRLRSSDIKILSENMLFLKQYVPCEFNRKPRSLNELSYWKATEFRNFLLYYGPFILKDNIDISIYEHFLLLHVGISILISSSHLSVFGTNSADKLLNTFIKHCQYIYGPEFYVYNIHTLCHLAHEAKLYGTLDSFSAFAFENFLGLIKSFIRSPVKPLQQIYNRLSEKNFYLKPTCLQKNLLFNEHENSAAILNIVITKQYKKIFYNNFTLSVKSYSMKDAYCMTKKGLVIEIHHICTDINDEMHIIGKQFLNYKSLYNYPINSKDINIYVISDVSDLQVWKISEVLAKCMVFPNGMNSLNFVSIPLLHTT